MANLKVLQSYDKQDEIEYLKIICDSLVENSESLESGSVDLNQEFLKELKSRVDSTLTVDSSVQEDVRAKVLNAFDLLIENYARYL